MTGPQMAALAAGVLVVLAVVLVGSLGGHKAPDNTPVSDAVIDTVYVERAKPAPEKSKKKRAKAPAQAQKSSAAETPRSRDYLGEGVN